MVHSGTDNVNHNHKHSSHSDDLVFVLSVCLVIIEILGLLCNGIILTVYHKYSRLRTATNLFILNLAVCNFFLALLQLVLSTPSFFNKEWLYGKGGCIAYGFAHQYLISVAVITLAVIAFDRFCVITKPVRKLKTFIVTKPRAKALICVSHIYSFMLTFPLLIGWNELAPETRFNTGCYIRYSHRSPSSIAYTITSTVCTCIAPLLVTACCYAKIYQSVRKSSRRCTLYGHQHNTVKKEAFLRKKSLYHTRTARMIWTVMFFFLLTWLPTRAVGLVAAFGCPVPPLAVFLCVFLAKSCVMYNAVVYVFLNHRFRAAFLHMTFVCREESRLRFTTDATSVRNFGEILPSIVDASERSRVLSRKSLSQLNFAPAAKIPELSSCSGRISNADQSLPIREPSETPRQDSICDRKLSVPDRNLSETFHVDLKKHDDTTVAWSSESAYGSCVNEGLQEEDSDGEMECEKKVLGLHIPKVKGDTSETNNELSCDKRGQTLSHMGCSTSKADNNWTCARTESQLSSTVGQERPVINKELSNTRHEITTFEPSTSEENTTISQLQPSCKTHKSAIINYGFNNRTLQDENDYTENEKSMEKYLELDIRSLSNVA